MSNNRCLGLLSAFRLSQQLVPARENAAAARMMEASLPSMVETFAGEVLAGTLERAVRRYLLVVAAMGVKSFSRRLARYAPGEVILFVGDREDIQRLAIRAGVRAIVITGGLGISAGHPRGGGGGRRHRDRLRLRYGHGGAAGARRGAGGSMVSAELFTFSPETLLDEAREKAVGLAPFRLPGGG